jgi:hypothetical protein
MKMPAIQGLIDRRILVNYRVRPDVLPALLPSPFRPQLVEGHGIAGICLIRLRQLRPRGLPAVVGVASENAAHRIAVEWDEAGGTRCGVYIPRRDTSSWFNYLAGGRLFPGVHHRARFDVEEANGRYRIAIQSRDDQQCVCVEARVARELPRESVFESVAAASKFFEHGSLGYSPNSKRGQYDGLELHSSNWRVEPLAVDRVESTFFENECHFPPGSVEFDCALLMCGIRHEWHARKPLCMSCA